MRDATKSKTKNIKQCDLPNNAAHVVDGGALLRTVKWLPNLTYEVIVAQYKDLLRTVKWLPNLTHEGIVAQYKDYPMATFGPCIVVFDGYENGANTKVHKHQIRGAKLSQTVTIELNRKVEVPQNIFLKNGKNEKMFIKLLGNNLRANGFSIFEAIGYADTLIVKAAIQQAIEGTSVVVHADDVDVFCMQMHHCNGHSYDVYFNTVKETDGSRKSRNIKDVNESLDQRILKSILFLHAWTGCDTTSVCLDKL